MYDQDLESIDFEERLRAVTRAGNGLCDTRSAEAYAEHHVVGSTNIPITEV